MDNQPDHYRDFVDLTDELYRYCTLTEKLRVYVQHKPGSVVPLLEQLIREKEENEKQHDQHPSSN